MVFELDLGRQFRSDLIELQFQERKSAILLKLRPHWLRPDTFPYISPQKLSQILTQGNGTAVQIWKKGALEYLGIDANIDCPGGILGQLRGDVY